jgi:hypothetical protein
VEILTMKITTLFLAIPLAFGSGIALAQSTTTTETTMNPDGSVSTERSKTVTHE